MDINTTRSMSNAAPLFNEKQAMHNMKYEIASELAISVPQNDSWGNVTSRECGRVGGNMTKKLVAMGKAQLQ